MGTISMDKEIKYKIFFAEVTIDGTVGPEDTKPDITSKETAVTP